MWGASSVLEHHNIAVEVGGLIPSRPGLVRRTFGSDVKRGVIARLSSAPAKLLF
jgi:hypothetical protein